MSKPIACALGILATGVFAPKLSAGAETAQAKPATRETAIVLRFPRGVRLRDVGLAADGSLRLGAKVTVKPAKHAPAILANVGRGLTQVGASSQTTSIVSVGPVALQKQAKVAGEVTTAARLARPSTAQISGVVSELTLLHPIVERRWTVDFPVASAADVLVAANTEKKLSPGAYGHVRVQAGGKLTLYNGKYFVKSLEVAPKGQLLYLGYWFTPATIYSVGRVSLKGDVAAIRDGRTYLLLVALGSEPVVAERAFTGTIFAPKARLVLGGSGIAVEGQFYARDLEVKPGTTLSAAPLHLDAFLFDGPNKQPSGDTDHDGLDDYLEACPYDGQKQQPGVCGCGVPDSDENGDGFTDCLGVKAGDPNGRCGQGPACTPAPGCSLVLWEQSAYWICAATTAARTNHPEAEKFCRAKGLHLAHADSPEENTFLQSLLRTPAWVASSRRCQALDNVDGRMLEADCTTRLAFICEHEFPVQIPAPKAAKPSPCVSEPAAGFSAWNSADELKAAQAEFAQQIASAKAGSFTGAAANPPGEAADDRIELCNPKAVVTARLEPKDSLTPAALRIADLFPQGPAITTWSAEYDDPAKGKGTQHSWCRMSSQNPQGLAPIVLRGLDRSARISADDRIRITLDPDVRFAAKSQPLPFGDVSPNLHAQTKLVAHVAMKDFLGITYDAHILTAVADIAATRCGLRTDASELKVFGTNVANPQSLPLINSEDGKSPLYAAGQGCARALADFQNQAGDTKKSFRDAQQLLFQLRQVTQLDKDTLCAEIAANAQEGWSFPGGPQCYNNESIELIINRFIYNYSPNGETGTMRRDAQKLAAATAQLSRAIQKQADLEFHDSVHQETRSIGNVAVTLGPVPLVVQLDLTVSYGMAGRFAVDLAYPLNLDGPTSGHDAVARVESSTLPHVSAALTAVIAADPKLAAFSAVAQAEGVVSLGDIRAPLFATVGLGRTAFPDTRPLPSDIKPPVARSEAAFSFGSPRRYQYEATFEYGAGLDVLSALDGKIHTQLTVPMGNGHRTWSKPLVDLQGASGHFDLVKAAEGTTARTRTVPGTDPMNRGSTTTVVKGQTPIGVWESEVPLVEMALVDENARYTRGPTANDTRASVDMSKLERVFYDDLCRAKPGEPCHLDGTWFPRCQMFSICKTKGPGLAGICEAQCRRELAPCKKSSDCCAGSVCNWLNRCQTCRKANEHCVKDKDCCSGLVCDKKQRLCLPPQKKEPTSNTPSQPTP